MISFLIPFQSQDLDRLRAFEFVCHHLDLEWRDAEIVIGSSAPVFNRTTAINNAARRATGEIFIVLDADTYAPGLQEAVDWVEQHGNWFLPYDTYFALTRHATDVLIRGDSIEALQDLHDWSEYVFPSEETPEPAVSGCVVVTRQAFELVGGFDERFIGWGEEDRAFEISLRTLLGPARRSHQSLFHLWHPEGERFAQPNFEANRALCNRYREAEGNLAKMRKLISERRR